MYACVCVASQCLLPVFLFLANGLLLAAVDSILKDKSFMLPSDCAKATVSTTKTISTWATKHQSLKQRDLKEVLCHL